MLLGMRMGLENLGWGGDRDVLCGDGVGMVELMYVDGAETGKFLCGWI